MRKRRLRGVPIVAQWKQIRLGTVRLRVPSLASLSELRIQHCHELWYGIWVADEAQIGRCCDCGIGARPQL